MAIYKKNAYKSHQNRKKNSIVQFVVIKIIATTNIINILTIIKFSEILVRKMRVT